MASKTAFDVRLEEKMRRVLYESVRTLFPLFSDPHSLIKRHIWRDRRYVGEANGKVVAWRGLSANLVSIDFRYRAIFLDLVDNTLPLAERVALFGEPFAFATKEMPQFIVAFVLDFPRESAPALIDLGFVPRYLPTAAHACVVADIDRFLSEPTLSWAAQIARLVVVQRLMSIHRKPLDTAEVPLQNLLYSTGYLHGYIVRNGLELKSLSPPRRAGEFGHDLHAIVRNPTLPHRLEDLGLGIEVYTGAIGYHLSTIPQYIADFDLKGMIVISKDDPMPTLIETLKQSQMEAHPIPELAQIGRENAVGLHHLPLSAVVGEFQSIRDELETIIPTVPITAI